MSLYCDAMHDEADYALCTGTPSVITTIGVVETVITLSETSGFESEITKRAGSTTKSLPDVETTTGESSRESATNPPSQDDEDKKSPNSDAIIGGAVGGVLALSITAAAG